MGFGEAVRVCLSKYVDFNGRARRAEYWWFVVFALLVGIATAIVDRVIAPGYVAVHGRGPVSMVASLALLLPSLAVSVRRLHDIDRTGWWVANHTISQTHSANMIRSMINAVAAWPVKAAPIAKNASRITAM